MATIAATNLGGSGKRTATETTLTGTADKFVYSPGSVAVLILRNPTVSGITPTIVGDAATTYPVAGLGAVDVSGGYEVGEIAASAAVAIPLSSIAAYLSGEISITGGTGLVASLLRW